MFWHEQRHLRKDEGMWDRNEDRKQVLDKKKEKKKGRKEEINSTRSFRSSFSPHVVFVYDFTLIQ